MTGNLADAELVSIRMLLNGHNFAHHHTSKWRSDGCYSVDFQTGHGDCIG